jgi:hypothetical protein
LLLVDWCCWVLRQRKSVGLARLRGLLFMPTAQRRHGQTLVWG